MSLCSSNQLKLSTFQPLSSSKHGLKWPRLLLTDGLDLLDTPPAAQNHGELPLLKSRVNDMRERRTSPRVKVNLPAVWEGASMLQEGNVTSLSKTGCFVLSGGKVESKELIRLEINISEAQPLSLWGEVVDEAYEIGFAVRFNAHDDDEHNRLRRFVDKQLSQSPPA